MFINLPAPGTSQAVCSQPNVDAASPAEMESEQISEVLAHPRPWLAGGTGCSAVPSPVGKQEDSLVTGLLHFRAFLCLVAEVFFGEVFSLFE